MSLISIKNKPIVSIGDLVYINPLVSIINTTHELTLGRVIKILSMKNSDGDNYVEIEIISNNNNSETYALGSVAYVIKEDILDTHK